MFMRTVEQYWQSFEDIGFIKEKIPGGYRYSILEHLGEGGFELWGDPGTCFACISDILYYKPLTILEYAQEKMIEFGQFYTGDVSFYQKKSNIHPVDHGLNYLVTPPFLVGYYKRMEAGQRLLNVGVCYREKFFETLPFTLPEDFWEAAAAVLNPGVLEFPAITAICEQIRNCRLTGTNLEMFIQGKGLEAFALTLEYIYKNKKREIVHLTAQDRKGLESVTKILEDNILSPPSIKNLALQLGMNQKKMMAGFKQINGVTIYGYLKRIRMQLASQLLQENSLSISEIAQAVGYHGDGHFQQAFREVYGVPPSKLRKELLVRYEQ